MKRPQAQAAGFQGRTVSGNGAKDSVSIGLNVGGVGGDGNTGGEVIVDNKGVIRTKGDLDQGKAMVVSIDKATAVRMSGSWPSMYSATASSAAFCALGSMVASPNVQPSSSARK